MCKIKSRNWSCRMHSKRFCKLTCCLFKSVHYFPHCRFFGMIWLAWVTRCGSNTLNNNYAKFKSSNFFKPNFQHTHSSHSSLQKKKKKKKKKSIKDFFSNCDQISRKLRIWSHLLKKSLIVNLRFCVVHEIMKIILRATSLRIRMKKKNHIVGKCNFIGNISEM